MNDRQIFDWQRHPEAEAYVTRQIDRLVTQIPQAQQLARDLLARTGSRLADWVDHVVLADGDLPRGELADLGFEPEEVPAGAGETSYHHSGAILPRVLLREGSASTPAEVLSVALQVEEVASFLMVHRIAAPIEGSPLSPYRRASVWPADGATFQVVERRGHGGFVPRVMPDDYPQRYLDASERWATRPRLFADEREGLDHSLQLARSLVSELGTDAAAWLAFEAERAYWQRRNWSGQVQKARQDSLGLGWANHDHHTFRSSREGFALLIQILETFGFQPRERFYAGAEAGWGAQVMEQPVCRFAVFADVDLSPEEVEGDFAHQPLAPRRGLGTVGLWSALHGGSMLSAGLHHLAARFDFGTAAAQLAELGVAMMKPFSEFPYLLQAFTRGELWQVSPGHLDSLERGGQISPEQRARFSERGSIGSHLENIQRGEGFKGFNQETISDIIRRTDPRAEQSNR